ncbi:FG-GAP-like repeat-containing protein [Hymenobacter agri]
MKQLLLGTLLLVGSPAFAQSLGFAAPVLYSNSQGGSGPIMHDVNSDGLPDMVQIGSSGSAITVRLNTGAGGFAATTSSYSSGTSSAASLAAGDINADGKADIALVSLAARSLSVLLGNGSGGFSVASTYVLPANPTPIGLLVKDVNKDGRADVLIVGSTPSAVGVLLSQGSGGFAPIVQYGANPFNAAAVDDLNGDGNPDLLFGGNTLDVYLGDGTGAFAPATPVYSNPLGGTPAQQLQVGDIDNDGKMDVVVLNQVATGTTVSKFNVLLGTGNGGLRNPTAYTLPYTSYGGMVLSDLNRDGLLDFGTVFNGTNSVGVLLNQPGGAFPATATLFPTGNSSVGLTAVDVNGDAKPDLITNNSSATNVVVSVLLNSSALSSKAERTASSLMLYPNPAHSGFTVQVPQVKGAINVQATLHNLLGQCVAAQVAPSLPVGASLAFSTAGLATGVYLLRLHAGDSTWVQRVTVE